MPRTHTKLTRVLAPEEIRRGDYVVILHQIEEYMPCCVGLDPSLHPEPLRVRWMTPEPTPPLHVVEVCLPFVWVRRPCGGVDTLDVRRHALGRVGARRAARVLAHLHRRGR